MTPEDATALTGHKDLIKVLDYLEFMLKDSRNLIWEKLSYIILQFVIIYLYRLNQG